MTMNIPIMRSTLATAIALRHSNGPISPSSVLNSLLNTTMTVTLVENQMKITGEISHLVPARILISGMPGVDHQGEWNLISKSEPQGNDIFMDVYDLNPTGEKTQ